MDLLRVGLIKKQPSLQAFGVQLLTALPEKLADSLTPQGDKGHGAVGVKVTFESLTPQGDKLGYSFSQGEGGPDPV